MLPDRETGLGRLRQRPQGRRAHPKAPLQLGHAGGHAPDLRAPGLAQLPTLTLLKSSCVCSVYICSVRSILWAPSLHCLTSCNACAP